MNLAASPGPSAQAYNPGLSALVYRSRAVRSLAPAELHDLTSVSQRRNGREGITGLMLYDNDRFYQWLEGPPDGVNRVMDSIRSDARHTDVEILNAQTLQSRRFANWNMKLAVPGAISAPLPLDVIDPPQEIVDVLRKRPEAAPALLVRLVPLASGGTEASSADMLSNMKLPNKAAAILKNVFLAAVVPQLAGAAANQSHKAVDPRIAELANLLVATDPHAAVELIREINESGSTIGALSASLLEPAARHLGDLWSEDFCSEFDVTLGLCRLQTAVRLLSPDVFRLMPGKKKLPVVLVAPEPGELHRLGAVLDSSILQSAGWAPHTEYPSNGNALDDLLSATWFDVLDLSLSAAFRRDQSLPQIARTIADARRASQNPELVVVVGGRVFLEEEAAGASVGADQALTTSRDVSRSILKTLSARESATPMPLAVAS